MKTAFDAKELLVRLVPVVSPAIETTVDWAAESLEMNESPYVKLLGGVVRSIKQPVMDEINKAIAKIGQDEQPVQGPA